MSEQLYEDQSKEAIAVSLAQAVEDAERKTYEAFRDGTVPELVKSTQPQGRTLDQLADDTLTRVSRFLGECVGADSFCGLSVDEMRDEDGKLLSLRFVPCDMIGGQAVRRVER